ncbi:MAG TPA: Ig-like domain-containing protein, partial [Ktedonobacterales bacterium]
STVAQARRVSVCAVDPIRGDCVTGDFQALNRAQSLRVVAMDSGGKPQPGQSIMVTITGPNARTATITAGSDGVATYTYSGTHAGTDTIAAALTNAGGSSMGGNAAIHWLQPHQVVHPILWVHGINEDASVLRHGIAQDDLAVLTQHNEDTEIFEALDLVYDRSYIEAFCYVDDHAYTHSPSGCPAPESASCVSGNPSNDCISQSSVDANAVELAKTVSALSARAGGKSVTVMSYSMGGGIVRTLLAGCRNISSAADVAACSAAVPLVDHVFFLNGAQQGSWLMTAKSGWDPASVSGQGIPSGATSPFAMVLPLLEQGVYLAVKGTLGLDTNHAAEQDLTPQSANILAHNSVLPPASIDLYNFYGDIQLQADVNVYIYQLKGTQPLPLGDLVMLAQDDDAQAAPLWGGAALCEGCATPIAPYREAGQYHAWALIDRHEINLSGLAPLLNAPDAFSSFTGALKSPVMHLNITQPVALAPGSAVQVRDITGLAGTTTTDIPFEMLAILMQKDGIA